MNVVVLIGRLTRDPELRYIPNTNTPVANFAIAIDKKLSKEKKEEMEGKGLSTADFVNIVVWGKLAEHCANYLIKGRLVGVSGKIQSRSYEAKDGSKRYVTEVIAEYVQFLDFGKNQNTQSKQNNQSNQSNRDMPWDIEGFNPVDCNNIPF